MNESIIKLRWLDLQYSATVTTRMDKIAALARLNIAVSENQSPLNAWLLAMCRENELSEELPNRTISEVILDDSDCTSWMWWLA